MKRLTHRLRTVKLQRWGVLFKGRERPFLAYGGGRGHAPALFARRAEARTFKQELAANRIRDGRVVRVWITQKYIETT